MGGQDFIIFSTGGAGAANPPWNDPAKFPRAEPIADDEAILRLGEIERLLERFQELREEAVRLNEQIAIVQSDLDSQKARLFPTLRQKHKQVASGFGYGWRKHDGKYYVVGWDEGTILQARQQGRAGEPGREE